MDEIFRTDRDPDMAEEFPDRMCAICQLTTEGVQLDICRMCFKEICGDCAFKGSGGRFCSRNCHEAFLYGADEEDLAELEKE